MDKLIIGTHNGIFHCDEIIAISLFNIFYAGVRNIEVIRTRNTEILENQCNLLIDIGGKKFDHHQKGGNGKRENGVSYASAGLVWKELGIQIINKLSKNTLNFKEEMDIFEDIDKTIIQKIDMEDNGEGMVMHPFSFINAFLPNWNDVNPNYDVSFDSVLNVSTEILDKLINHKISVKLGIKELDERIRSKDKRINNILVIPSQTISWLERVIEYNKILLYFHILMVGLHCNVFHPH